MPEQSLSPQSDHAQIHLLSERRAAVRYACNHPASCLSIPACENISARVRDVSVQGIGLLMSRRFEPDTILLVEVTGTPQPSFLVRVVHCAPLATGEWVIGCQFDVDLDEEELRALLSTQPAPHGPK